MSCQDAIRVFFRLKRLKSVKNSKKKRGVNRVNKSINVTSVKASSHVMSECYHRFFYRLKRVKLVF